MILHKKAIFVTALALMIQPALISQAPASPKHRVVVQMSEPQGAAWTDLLVHVNNLVANLIQDGGVQVEVVFIGPGLNMLLKSNTSDEQGLKRLADHGVTFMACQNSMGALKVTTEDLFPFASQVRSGVAEIVRKQESGWSYIH